MESRPLRYFVAVARARSITRAAEQLGMAQPPLSRHIQALEREVGTLLFDRIPGGLRLTAAGQAMLEKAEPALAMLEEARQSAIAVAQATRTVLPIGFVSVAGYSLLPRLTRAFQAQHPGIELRLEGMTNSEQAQALARGAIELGIAWLPFDGTDCAQVALHSEPLLVAIPTGHALARLQRVGLEQMRNEQLILGSRNLAIRRAILRAVTGTGDNDDPGRVRKANDLAEAIDCVASGLGITLVPASLRHERRQHVEYRELERPETVVLGAVHGAAPSRAAQQFIDCARRLAPPAEA